MHPNCFPILLLAALVSSCATRAPQTVSKLTFPPDAFITQRAILNARGKQFTFNGYLAQNAAGSKRLILMESFGGVLADLIIRPNGDVHVMRSSPALKPAWLKRYVARDVQCLFGAPPPEGCKVTEVSAKHFVVKRWLYTLDVHVLEVRPGPQPFSMFETNSPGGWK